VNEDDQSLYAEMRAAIRGDRERAERRANRATETKRVEPELTPPPQDASPPRRGGRLRRLFRARD
jgi:hypothetical protein